MRGEFETERPSVVHIAVCFKDSAALFSCFLKQKIKVMKVLNTDVRRIQMMIYGLQVANQRVQCKALYNTV